MEKLTKKQKRFCDEYLIDLNATQAAIKAGYSEKNARTIASENLTKPNIRNYITERMAEKEAELIASQDEVLKFLTAVMRGEETDTQLITNALGEIESKDVRRQVNQMKAAELLGKRYSLFTDKIETEIDMDLNITIDYGDD